MYTARYVVKTVKTPKGKKEQRTVLKAKLRFGEEVPKILVDDVKKRLKFQPKYTPVCKNFSGLESNVYSFLYQKANLKFSGINPFPFSDSYVFDERSFDEKQSGRRVIRVSDTVWTSLGINIFGIGKGCIPLEEMLDLDALNEFILKGE